MILFSSVFDNNKKYFDQVRFFIEKILSTWYFFKDLLQLTTLLYETNISWYLQNLKIQEYNFTENGKNTVKLNQSKYLFSNFLIKIQYTLIRSYKTENPIKIFWNHKIKKSSYNNNIDMQLRIKEWTHLSMPVIGMK